MEAAPVDDAVAEAVDEVGVHEYWPLLYELFDEDAAGEAAEDQVLVEDVET